MINRNAVIVVVAALQLVAILINLVLIVTETGVRVAEVVGALIKVIALTVMETAARNRIVHALSILRAVVTSATVVVVTLNRVNQWVAALISALKDALAVRATVVMSARITIVATVGEQATSQSSVAATINNLLIEALIGGGITVILSARIVVVAVTILDTLRAVRVVPEAVSGTAAGLGTGRSASRGHTVISSVALTLRPIRITRSHTLVHAKTFTTGGLHTQVNRADITIMTVLMLATSTQVVAAMAINTHVRGALIAIITVAVVIALTISAMLSRLQLRRDALTVNAAILSTSITILAFAVMAAALAIRNGTVHTVLADTLVFGTGILVITNTVVIAPSRNGLQVTESIDTNANSSGLVRALLVVATAARNRIVHANVILAEVTSATVVVITLLVVSATVAITRGNGSVHTNVVDTLIDSALIVILTDLIILTALRDPGVNAIASASALITCAIVTIIAVGVINAAKVEVPDLGTHAINTNTAVARHTSVTLGISLTTCRVVVT